MESAAESVQVKELSVEWLVVYLVELSAVWMPHPLLRHHRRYRRRNGEYRLRRPSHDNGFRPNRSIPHLTADSRQLT